MAESDLYFKIAQGVALEAGEIIKEAFYKEKEICTKECFADLVTETDQRVEKTVISIIKEQFPTHSFIGEESIASGERCKLTDNPTWIIDPIDGTTNFVHKFPYVCISIALLVDKQPVVAVVYNPILNEMYTAQPGKGAFLNYKPIHVSKASDLKSCSVLSEYGGNREEELLSIKVNNIHNVVRSCQGIRSVGSAALSMCLVAQGSADAYFEHGIHCWDIAAGMLIAKEAGGVVVDTEGGEFDLMSRRLVCANNQKIAEEIVSLIEDVPFQRD
ncbi:inositol monophosphatase 1-like isoform X1 [Tubulanus polymorphus]|uniref:inositol monophosphatase 1-like isoform X1 n=1 Tax=Tubulanus polymorphus TaxID=672921 RepID=UPI003DA4A894